MSEKPMTVTEMARMGGIARSRAHTKAELRAWGKEGGRPRKLDGKALISLEKMLAEGKSQAECARILRVSVRTVGRIVTKGR